MIPVTPSTPQRLRRRATATGLALLALACAGLSAQTPQDSLATLRGRVVSGMTGAPLAEARVELLRANRGAFTDSAGRFLIDEVAPGRDTVRVHLIGFATHAVPLTLEPNRVTVTTLLLSRNVLKLEDLSVEVRRRPEDTGKLAGFEERRRMGNGVFIGPEEVAEKRADDAADLLRGEPGISVGPATVGRTTIRMTRSQRNCEPFIWLDGAPKIGMHIDDLSAEEILAMELYRGAAETPPQFAFRQGTCATLVIWTRTGGYDESRRP